MHELPNEFLKDLRLIVLGNQEILRQSQNWAESLVFILPSKKYQICKKFLKIV